MQATSFQKNEQTWLERWHLWLLALAWLIPPLVLSYFRVTDGFLYISAGYAESAILNGKMTIDNISGYNYGRQDFFPSYPMILLILRQITGLPMLEVIFLPIGGPLLCLVTYAVARRILGDWRYAAILSLFAATDFTLAHHYNVFAYSWTFPLYLLFVSQLLDLFDHYDLKRLIILFVLFGGGFLLHYAVGLWMLVSVIILAVFQRLRLAGSSASSDSNRLGPAFAFTVIFMAYNRVFYDLWLPQVVQDSGIDQSVQTFVGKLASLLLGAENTVEPYTSESQYGGLFATIRLLEYGVILAALIAGGVILIRAGLRWHAEGTLRSHAKTIFFPVLIAGTTASEVLAYSVHGWVPVKFIVLAFPLIIAFMLTLSPKGTRWTTPALAAMFVLSAAGFGLAVVQISQGEGADELEMEAGSDWLQQTSAGTPLVLADLSTSGRLLLEWSEDGKLFKPTYFDASGYGVVVGDEPMTPQVGVVEYVAIDTFAARQGVTTHGVAEKIYDPLGERLEAIDRNSAFNAVYDNGSVLLLRGITPVLA